MEQKNIDCWELGYVSVSLELLSYLVANCGDGQVEGVHVLDFRGL
jgi:hypothetical protein